MKDSSAVQARFTPSGPFDAPTDATFSWLAQSPELADLDAAVDFAARINAPKNSTDWFAAQYVAAAVRGHQQFTPPAPGTAAAMNAATAKEALLRWAHPELLQHLINSADIAAGVA